VEIDVKRAKVDLSKLIALASRGESVVITSRGILVAELVAAQRKPAPDRGYGIYKELLKDLPDDWDSPAEKAKTTALFDGLE
jgi:antitoxin (DNA-binding transcriptional repressor) of toxin-antitoxin stability system